MLFGRHYCRSHPDMELTAIRGGMTAEEYRWHLIRTYLRD
jgi:hypothetical protein